MTAGVAVEVSELVKEYPAPGRTTLRAVDGISFAVHTGEVFGFLGPNGAGKTTTLEIIEGLVSPTSGHTTVLGFDSVRDREKMKQRIGVQLQAGAYFDFLTLEEILDLFGSFYDRQADPRALLEKVGLEEKSHSLLRQLSGGQAHRFSIVAAMVNDPNVVFLDEPTTGLDPQARHNLWDLVSAMNRDEGKTIVVTTHYMEEAEALCDRVAIIDHGKICALDTPQALIQQLEATSRIAFAAPRPLDEAELKSLPGVVGVTSGRNKDNAYELQVTKAQETLPPLVRWASKHDVPMTDVRVLPATLEDVFLSLTGRSLRE